ncbi:Protein kinase domain-containing protein [Heracleum sosnowskyi]|uniref:Protein kinase domain-containing protein n=1 Tax=Heracleum sosnowskyi TaxID=360622 RepID=A0AAD8HFB9_9APIA|nr:Protein kinase domain-containing protein [Heracleum sosnowskyi]
MAAVHCNHLFLFLMVLSFTPFSHSISESEALLQFKASIINARALDSWRPDTPPCPPQGTTSWVGLSCANKQVRTISLFNMGLAGKIDTKPLEQLHGLRFIIMANNSLTGPIPEFNRLAALKAFYISSNKFSGEIPSDYFANMKSLKKLWLANNEFSGKIPESVTQLPILRELRLENNHFSGPIPQLNQQSLVDLDLSNNKLEGEIPEPLLKFNATAFKNNTGVCSKKLGIKCTAPSPGNSNDANDPSDVMNPPGTPNSQSPPPEDDSSSSQAKWVVLGIVIILLTLTILFKAKRPDDKLTRPTNENPDEALQVNIPGTDRKNLSSTSRNRNHSRRVGSSKGGKPVNDLVVVNDEKGVFGLSDLMKAAAEVLGNGGLGSAYKAIMANGVSVVVKRLREMNQITKDTFDAEMRRLGALNHKNILTPLAYHFRKDEKLFVSEFVSRGSLLYLLHGDRGDAHSELNWPTRLKIIQGIARGMGYLHSEFPSYELPHGNLKSSNVLLNSNYEPLLSDYAMYLLLNNTPTAKNMFAFKSPDQQISPKTDVYCLGILILEILTGKFPSQYLNNQKGGTDVVEWVRTAVSEKRVSELIDPEIAGTSAASLEEMEKLLQIGNACTEGNQDKRLDMKEAIRRIEEIQV